MSYFREADTLRAHIRSLRVALGCVTALALALAGGWYSAPSRMRVHVPPDLRATVEQGFESVPAPTVFAFSHYLWTQIHGWPKNGHDDYQANLYRYQAYLTPACRQSLQQEYEQRARNGELAGRTRSMHLTADGAYAEERVDVLDRDAWVTWLDEEIEETVNGVPVKSIVVRYPLRVVRVAIDVSANPWGLAIACYAAAPTLLGDGSALRRPPIQTRKPR